MAQGKIQTVTIVPKKQLTAVVLADNQKIAPTTPPIPMTITKNIELIIKGGALVPDTNDIEPGINTKDF